MAEPQNEYQEPSRALDRVGKLDPQETGYWKEEAGSWPSEEPLVCSFP